MSEFSSDLPRLASLGDQVRNKHIRTAKRTLFVLGVLMIIGQTIIYFVERSMLRREIENMVRRDHPGIVVSPEEMDELEQSGQRILLLIDGGAVVMGVVFFIMGFFVERYPVTITAAALAMYIGLILLYAAIDPRNLCAGIIVKVIVIVFLSRALRAGLAAANENRIGRDPEVVN